MPIAGFAAALAVAWRDGVTRVLGSAAAEAPLRVGLAGVLGCVEDQDQLRLHAGAARTALPQAELILGDIDQLAACDGRLRLRGVTLDVLFRFYPLDWLAVPERDAILDVLAGDGVTMLPPAHAVITQSKAFLALLHALDGHGFFPPHESDAVRAWVPRTVLDPRALGRRPYVVKPYLDREGHGVRFSREMETSERRRLARQDVVYQREVAVARLAVPVGTAHGWRSERRVLVFGVFLAGENVAGVYTRAGAPITGREAVFLPLLTGE
jgi:glutathionylspermidine synthase